MAGKGGGAWKVAYADFVTAMMAFFMVMWITGQSKEVKSAVAQYFRDPTGTWKTGGTSSPFPSKWDGGTGGAKRPEGTARSRGRGRNDTAPPALPTPQAERRMSPGANMFVLHDGSQSATGAVVLFVDDNAELDEAATLQLERLAPSLVGKPNKIEIRGHTSRRPLPPQSPFTDPWQLCYARCQRVLGFLEKAGVEPDRIRLSQAAAFEPMTLKVDPRQQAQNSRVEVLMLAELAEDLVGTRQERAARFATP